MPIIDIHTHCSPPRPPGDRFGVQEALRGTPVGKDMVTNYRGFAGGGLPPDGGLRASAGGLRQGRRHRAHHLDAVYRRGHGRRFKSPALDICKAVNDGIAGIVARAPGNWGMGTLNPLDKSQIAEAERCFEALKFKGLLICSSWHGRFIDGEDSFAFWEWAQDRQAPVFIHPLRVPIGHEQQMDQFKLDELIGRPFDTAMALARMILSGLFDRYPRLKIVVAHMGGGLLPCMGRLDFGWRLGSEGMPISETPIIKKYY